MVVADIHGIRPAELIEHQKKGGKVFGTFCVYVPDEIVFAADAIATGLCGGLSSGFRAERKCFRLIPVR